MNRLREQYEAQGWTRAEIAKALEVNPVTIWRWETGRYIMRADVLEKLCTILGVLPKDLK